MKINNRRCELWAINDPKGHSTNTTQLHTRIRTPSDIQASWYKGFLCNSNVQLGNSKSVSVVSSLSISLNYEGRSINKLQNGVILLIFKTWKIWNHRRSQYGSIFTQILVVGSKKRMCYETECIYYSRLQDIADVVGPRSEDPKLIIRVISCELTQHIRPRYISVTNGRADRQTDRQTDNLR